MADAVATQTIQDGERNAVLRFTNVSDGTGESNVVKLDFDASTNVLAIGLPADSTGDEYYDSFTAIPNNAGSGKTGDILFSTTGHSSGDTYMIILELLKRYD